MGSTITIIFVYITCHLFNAIPIRCQINDQCIIDCAYPNTCNSHNINATQSISLIIFGCNNNCNDMTIYCPQNTDNTDYECHILGHLDSTINNASIYAKSMDAINIMFDEIINSTLHCSSTRKCNINWDGTACTDNSTICNNNYIPKPTINGIVVNKFDLILYIGILLVVILFGCCAISICLMITFYHFRLKYHKQTMDTTIETLIKLKRKQSQIMNHTSAPIDSHDNQTSTVKIQIKSVMDEVEQKETELIKLHPISPVTDSTSPATTVTILDSSLTNSSHKTITTGELPKIKLTKTMTKKQWM